MKNFSMCIKPSLRNSLLLFCPLFFVLTLTSCTNNIKNRDLNDRVLACSASLDKEYALGLGSHFDENFADGKLSPNFYSGTRNIFDSLTQFPESDRIKLYELYIKCIEGSLQNTKKSMGPLGKWVEQVRKDKGKKKLRRCIDALVKKSSLAEAKK